MVNVGVLCEHKWQEFVCLMLFNGTFNNISAISWQSVLLVEETVVVNTIVWHQWITVEHSYHCEWPSCPWSNGSWIYTYLCNQCLSPLMLWVRISIRVRCTTLCGKVCHWLITCRWFSSEVHSYQFQCILILCKPNTCINQTNPSVRKGFGLDRLYCISWRSVLLVEETRVPGENHRPVVSQWQTLSHNVVSNTPHQERYSNSQLWYW
jgi:hypothetical protein